LYSKLDSIDVVIMLGNEKLSLLEKNSPDPNSVKFNAASFTPIGN
jgi:hypothetical protein